MCQLISPLTHLCVDKNRKWSKQLDRKRHNSSERRHGLLLSNLLSALCSSTGSHFSMLGIGDIVMPGLLLCFVLRYDNYKKQANGEVPGPGNMSGRMQRVSYFHCTLIGYFVGKRLINTCKRSQSYYLNHEVFFLKVND